MKPPTTPRKPRPLHLPFRRFSHQTPLHWCFVLLDFCTVSSFRRSLPATLYSLLPIHYPHSRFERAVDTPRTFAPPSPRCVIIFIQAPGGSLQLPTCALFRRDQPLDFTVLRLARVCLPGEAFRKYRKC